MQASSTALETHLSVLQTEYYLFSFFVLAISIQPCQLKLKNRIFSVKLICRTCDEFLKQENTVPHWHFLLASLLQVLDALSKTEYSRHNHTKCVRQRAHHRRGDLQKHWITHSSHSIIVGGTTDAEGEEKKFSVWLPRGEGMCQCAIPVIMWVSRALIKKTHPVHAELRERWAWLCIKLHEKLWEKCLKSPAL